MKKPTFAASLLAWNLFHLLPEITHSFTTSPTTTTITTTIPPFRNAAAIIRRSTTTNLHGLPPLPGFLTRNKASSDEETTTAAATADAVMTSGSVSDIPVLPGQGTISNDDMTTEITSFEPTTTTVPAETSSSDVGGEKQLTETQSLLQKVKQAGTAGGEFSNSLVKITSCDVCSLSKTTKS